MSQQNINDERIINQKINQEVDGISQKLHTLSDKVNLKAHLAGMEAKQSWESMTKSINNLADNLRRVKKNAIKDSQEARVQVHLALMEAKDHWDELQTHFAPLKKDLQNVKSEFDHARVQAHLASMETREAFEQRLHKVQKAYNKKVSPRVDELLSRLKKDIEEVDQSLSD